MDLWTHLDFEMRNIPSAHTCALIERYIKNITSFRWIAWWDQNNLHLISPPMCDSTGPATTGVGKISSLRLLYCIIRVDFCLIAWSGSQEIHDQRSNDQMDSPHRWQVIWKVLSWHPTIMLTLAKLWLSSPGLGLGCPRSSHLNCVRS